MVRTSCSAITDRAMLMPLVEVQTAAETRALQEVASEEGRCAVSPAPPDESSRGSYQNGSR